MFLTYNQYIVLLPVSAFSRISPYLYWIVVFCTWYVFGHLSVKLCSLMSKQLCSFLLFTPCFAMLTNKLKHDQRMRNISVWFRAEGRFYLGRDDIKDVLAGNVFVRLFFLLIFSHPENDFWTLTWVKVNAKPVRLMTVFETQLTTCARLRCLIDVVRRSLHSFSFQSMHQHSLLFHDPSVHSSICLYFSLVRTSCTLTLVWCIQCLK